MTDALHQEGGSRAEIWAWTPWTRSEIATNSVACYKHIYCQ
jgi:hypothetical protein